MEKTHSLQKIYSAGKDIATTLGYSNSRKALADHVAEEDEGVAKCDTPVGEEDKLSTQIEYAGQRREVTVINESGLYALILGSSLSTE